MCLARMATPAGNNRAVRVPIALKVLPKNRLTLLPEEKASVPWDMRGAKLAALDWPPPPSPSTASRSGGQSHVAASTTGGITSDVEGSNAGNDAVAWSASADSRARADLWQIRATIEREKLRMVAPFPFFGCPMRFQDDYAALQVTDDGRFSFSEVSLESMTTVTTAEASSEADSNASKIRPVVPDVKHVVTYEGVFAAPRSPTSDDEDHPQVNLRARSPTAGRRPRVDSGASQSPKGATGGARPKEAYAEEQPLRTQPEVASIEATGLVRHEIIEVGGRCRLVAVERGDFSFVITVAPFFHPDYATVKVLAKAKTGRQPPRRSRRLPYVGASSVVGGSGARTSNSVSVASPGKTTGRGLAGQRKKLSRSLALLPSATTWSAAKGETTPFRRAGVDSLSGRSKVLGCCNSMPHLP